MCLENRASSSACRLPPAHPQEVRRPYPRPPEPRPHLGGESGAAGCRAARSGSAPPGRVCGASKVGVRQLLLAVRIPAAYWLMYFVLSAQAGYSSCGGNMAEEFQKNCKFTCLNNVTPGDPSVPQTDSK